MEVANKQEHGFAIFPQPKKEERHVMEKLLTAKFVTPNPAQLMENGVPGKCGVHAVRHVGRELRYVQGSVIIHLHPWMEHFVKDKIRNHKYVTYATVQWMGSGRPGEVGHPAVFPVVEAFDKELVNVPVHNHNTEATSVKGKPLRMNFAMETYVLFMETGDHGAHGEHVVVHAMEARGGGIAPVTALLLCIMEEDVLARIQKYTSVTLKYVPLMVTGVHGKHGINVLYHVEVANRFERVFVNIPSGLTMAEHAQGIPRNF